MTIGAMIMFGILELGCMVGIGYLYDWRAGVAALLGSMVMRIVSIDTINK